MVIENCKIESDKIHLALHSLHIASIEKSEMLNVPTTTRLTWVSQNFHSCSCQLHIASLLCFIHMLLFSPGLRCLQSLDVSTP